MQPIRNLHSRRVISLFLELPPRIHNLGQHRPATITGCRIGDGQRCRGLCIEKTRIRKVEEHRVKGRLLPLPEPIARLSRDGRKDIRANVPAAEGVQAPISFNGGDLGVVVVVVGVYGADEVLRDGVAEEDGHDVVLLRVGDVFVEGDEDEGVVHEVFVFHEWLEEAADPGSGDGDGGVVAVIGWMGGKVSPCPVLGGGEVDLLLLGVMNIHCGRVFVWRSLSKRVKFLRFALRFGLEAMES